MSKSKTVIKRKVNINASKDRVWEVLADFGNVQNLSPNIAKSYLISEAVNGVGAKRHCDFNTMGAQVDEEIVAWNEGSSMKIILHNFKNMPMIKEMEAYFELSAHEGTTTLTGIFEYGMSNMMGDILNIFTMKKMNTKSWVMFMSGIKHHIETGEEVNKNTRLDFSAVRL